MLRYAMKILMLMLMLALLSGCSEIYGDLESAYGIISVPKNIEKLATQTFSVSSRSRKGIETYRGIASISISSEGISEFHMQFNSREAFNKQKVQSCLGY